MFLSGASVWCLVYFHEPLPLSDRIWFASNLLQHISIQARFFLLCTTTNTIHHPSPYLVDLMPFSSLPRGRMTISALIFAVLACGCAVMTNVTCDFVRVKTPGNVLNDDLFPSNFEAQTGRLGIGLWNFEDYLNNDHDGHYYSSCIMFNNTTDDFLDDKWKAARSMSVVANACLGISVLSCFAMMCLALPNFFFKFVAALLFLGCLCESLVFIVFASDMCDISDCQFSSGAGTAVAASVLALFAVSCVPTNILKPNDEPEAFVPGTGEQVHSNEAGTATAAVKTTVEPNGTTKTITSTVNADGSLTVVEEMTNPDAHTSLPHETTTKDGVEQPLAVSYDAA